MSLLFASALIPALMPFGLILSQWPRKDMVARDTGLDFSAVSADRNPAPLEHYTADDGAQLGLRRYPSTTPNAPLVVMVHGSGWHGQQFDRLARLLAEEGHADILVPDLRGHGPNPARRGDIDYIGQLEDDLAALIRAEARLGQKVVLLGHSSGGGLVVRFAGGKHGALLDGAVLLAPFLGHAAATTRKNSGGWARPLVRRIIGLSILNRLHITTLNRLIVIQFAFPAHVLDGPLGHTATRAYSYRLNTSFAPHADLAKDAKCLPDFLLVAGARDEAFRADHYQPTLAPLNGKGRYEIIPDIGHLAIVDTPATAQAVGGWLGQRS